MIVNSARAGIEVPTHRWGRSPSVYLLVNPDFDSRTRLDMSPSTAREIARTLKRMADLVDPPKKRGTS